MVYAFSRPLHRWPIGWVQVRRILLNTSTSRSASHLFVKEQKFYYSGGGTRTLKPYPALVLKTSVYSSSTTPPYFNSADRIRTYKISLLRRTCIPFPSQRRKKLILPYWKFISEIKTSGTYEIKIFVNS